MRAKYCFKASACAVTAAFFLLACSPQSNEQSSNSHLNSNMSTASENALNEKNIKLPTLALVNRAERGFSNVPYVLSRDQVLQALLTNNKEIDEPTANQLIDSLSLNAPSLNLRYQIDDLNQDGEWDEIAILYDIGAKAETAIALNFNHSLDQEKVLNSEHRQSKAQLSNIRFAKYDDATKSSASELTSVSRQAQGLPSDYATTFQMEGPAWENDNIGFRLYFDERNGFDIFGKSISEAVLDTAGIGENYHERQDWGMDILKVGRTLGAGALAFVDKSALVQLQSLEARSANREIASSSLTRLTGAEQTTASVVVEGPVRSILRLHYESLPVSADGAALVNLSQDIQIWVGQHYYTSTLRYEPHDQLQSENGVDALNIAVGIVNLH